MNKALDGLHKKILGSKFAEIVTEAEIEALVRAKQENSSWIPCSEKLPEPSDKILLIQCSGHPLMNVNLENAFELASYTNEGWIVEMWPEWKEVEVIAWMPLPRMYEEKGE